MLDITMTATRRPEIIERTIQSFKENMLWNCDCLLTANIDPVGGSEEDGEAAARVMEKHFNAHIRMPKVADFGGAFKWCWEQTTADYVLHLEEDWELLKPIDLSQILRLLELHKDLALLRLPAFPSTEKTMKNWNKFFLWNGEFFECPEDLRITVGFCGHPSIIKGEYIHRCVRWLESNRNPEKQFHKGGPRKLTAEVLRWRYGVFGGLCESPTVRDIGREWIVKSPWRKQGSKAFFNRWEKIDGV